MLHISRLQKKLKEKWNLNWWQRPWCMSTLTPKYTTFPIIPRNPVLEMVSTPPLKSRRALTTNFSRWCRQWLSKLNSLSLPKRAKKLIQNNYLNGSTKQITPNSTSLITRSKNLNISSPNLIYSSCLAPCFSNKTQTSQFNKMRLSQKCSKRNQ